MTTPKEMRDWSFKNSKFIILKDGQSFQARLLDAKPVTSRHDREREVMQYKFQFVDGMTKLFESGSGFLAELLADFLGKEVKITRRGAGNETKYEVGEVSLLV